MRMDYMVYQHSDHKSLLYLKALKLPYDEKKWRVLTNI